MSRTDGGRAVRIAQQSFEVIAESIPHIVWLANADGATDYFNDRGTAYTGFPRQVNYGWRWLELLHSDDAERARMAWEQATRTATPFELSYRIRRSDGQFRWHSCRALPVRGARGQIVRWIGTADDLDDHVQARRPDDAALLERQTRELRTLLAAVQPEAHDRFGYVEPATRQQRVDASLREAAPDVAAAEIHHDAPANGLITPRDVAVLRLVASGYTSPEIAHYLGWSLRTIELSRTRLRHRLGLRSRAEFVRYAYEAGLIDRNS